ncbi:N-acetylmannosamine-6-phosphate 2-epimerase [Synechococcus sp. PCC 7336]|uniref:N-acetylmannosamine-6-phosphate 2-epimerase n=1 Tax=Synechococcus sp. PCC 7336 TaxID=195250 RepID=UPI000345FE5B|nr:putative N-acetylmannosamine-6-phosphate 2-epimerase [Synechococcus sp. PCC 7336]
MNSERFNWGDLLQSLRHRLVVSCQAEGESPFNSPEGVAMFARAAEQNGAAAIRTEGVAKTRKIVETVSLPVIGLVKTQFPDGTVCITGSFQAVEDLLSTGCNLVAMDGTLRSRPAPDSDLNGPALIRAVKQRYDCIVLADISTDEDAAACVEAGADCLSTTLSGYTPATADLPRDRPNLDLVSRLTQTHHLPVFAEGRVNSPARAAQAIAAGAWAVVVGTAITRPDTITRWYVEAVEAAAGQ